MVFYDVRRWYWLVDKMDGVVFSSASSSYIPLSDAHYQSWLAGGGLPTRIGSEKELCNVLAEAAPDLAPQFHDGLFAYANRKQQAIANGGLTVKLSSGAAIFCATDADSKANLNSLYTVAQSSPSFTAMWVCGPSEPDIALTRADILEMAYSVGIFIQASFFTLSAVKQGIVSGAIMNKAQIDSAGWPATS